MTMLPHPTLTEHYGTAEEKPEFVNRLFDRAARHYDAVVGWGFLQSGASYRRWALKEHGLRPPHHLLDVACGTGLVAVEAATILGTAENITCLDPSEGMLEVARSKLAAHFILGRAEQLPLPDNSFDFLTMGYALRHVTSPGLLGVLQTDRSPAGRNGRPVRRRGHHPDLFRSRVHRYLGSALHQHLARTAGLS